MGAKPGDLIVAAAAKEQFAHSDTSLWVAGQLRLHLGDKLNLIDRSNGNFCGSPASRCLNGARTDKRWVSAQHPFTGIVEEDLDKLETAPWECRSKGYDLVLNGVELGSGSIRIHRQDVQERMFKALGLTRRAAAAALRIFSRCADVWDAAAWRDRAGNRSRGDAARGREIDSRSDRVPEDDGGAGFDGRFAEQVDPAQLDDLGIRLK